MSFDNFQMQKWRSQIVRARNVDEKNDFIYLICFFSFRVMVLKLPKILHFFQICADLSKKPKSIKAIYFYPSERPHHALSENRIFIGVQATVHEILKNKIPEKVLTQQKFKKIHQLKTLISSKL